MQTQKEYFIMFCFNQVAQSTMPSVVKTLRAYSCVLVGGALAMFFFFGVGV